VITKPVAGTLVLITLMTTSAAFAKELPDPARHSSAQSYTADEPRRSGSSPTAELRHNNTSGIGD
jgi:hypothetical protein